MTEPGPRTKAREFAFKFIYQFQLPDNQFDLNQLEIKLNDFQNSYGEEDSEHPDNVLDEASLNFAKSLIRKTLENWSDLETLVASKAEGWKLSNMDKVDLSILLISACELKHGQDAPSAVIINEGVNLAKKFGAKTSYSFINGVLDSLSKD